jgi:hypothetical protein
VERLLGGVQLALGYHASKLEPSGESQRSPGDVYCALKPIDNRVAHCDLNAHELEVAPYPVGLQDSFGK